MHSPLWTILCSFLQSASVIHRFVYLLRILDLEQDSVQSPSSETFLQTMQPLDVLFKHFPRHCS